jgi:hypothetical protein
MVCSQMIAAASAGEPARDGEDPQAEPFGFPAAGGAGQGEQLGPGQQLAGQRDDRERQVFLDDG